MAKSYDFFQLYRTFRETYFVGHSVYDSNYVSIVFNIFLKKTKTKKTKKTKYLLLI